MLETTNKTYHLSSAQDPQGGNCYSNQRPNRPITPTKNNPYCIGYDSPNSKKHRVSVPAHFTRSRGNPYPSCVRLRRLRRLCLGFGVGSLQPLQDFRLAMVDPVVTDVEQTKENYGALFSEPMSRKSSRHPVAECHLGRKLRCWFVQNQTFAKSHCVVNFWWFNKRKCQSFQ